jgi:arylsulfatase A-like enzyme
MRIAIPLASIAAVGGLVTAAEGGSSQDKAPGRPHIVHIVADDLGWRDVGFHGADIRTPHLDRLAAEGVRLDQLYGQPMCTPSRAALMTGRYPHRYGLQTLVIPSAGTYGLDRGERTLAQALGEAGYSTAMVGKWHLGHADRSYWPGARGFASQYGPLLGEIDYFTHEAHGVRDWFRNGEPVREQGYVTDLLTDEAVRVIGSHDAARPLFLYLAYTAPHAPYQAPPAALAAYAGIADPSVRSYRAMVTAMDEGIGKVVEALERAGMRRNTLLVFHSDNGGPRSAKFTGEVDMSASTIPADNGPFRDGKGSLYEGGTRIVGLACWPGRIPAATLDQPMHLVDWYPTYAGLAGATAGKPLDGLDLWPTLSAGAPSPRHEVVYGIEPFRAAVRQGDWKLVWHATLPSRIELFDLAHDPGETTNLSTAEPARVTALQRRTEELAREAVAPLIFNEALSVAKPALFGAVRFPGQQEAMEAQP